jgi:hypothetical protein
VLAIDTPTARYQPWLRRELAIGVSRAVPLQVALDDPVPVQLAQGVNQSIGVKVIRATGAMGPVRLSLFTSQVPPTVKTEAKPKAKGKKEKEKEDVIQTLRIEQPVVVAANQHGGTLPLIVPSALPAIEYDLAVRAELLSTDGQRVVAATVSPPRRVNVGAPGFTLVLSSSPKIEARAGDGPTGKFTGRIQRVGFPHPVKLSLAGLPEGLATPMLVVPGDKNDFEFAVSLPKGTKPGELKGVKLIGTAQLGPTKTVSAGNQIDVMLNVVPGE